MTKTKSAYSKLLLDPRWQKKRLEILNRDNWECQSCFDKEETLHVHHCYYEKDKLPWEYENESLLTVCATCHEEETNDFYAMKTFLSNTISSKGLLNTQLHELACAFYHIKLLPNDGYFISALSWFLEQENTSGIIKDLYSEHLLEKSKRAKEAQDAKS